MRGMYLGRVRDPQEEPAQGRCRVVERTARASISLRPVRTPPCSACWRGASRRPILDRQPALP